MRHIIIGDIHGCLSELMTMIQDLNLNTDDKLYFIGDLIDRGPDSLGVVKYVRDLSDKYFTILILGNHEEKLLRFIHHKKMNVEHTFKMQDVNNFNSLVDNLSITDIDFLSSSYLNYNIRDENIILIHGGIPENLKFDFKDNFKYSYELLKANKGLELILKTRYLDDFGNFIGLGKEDENSIFWADKYKGQHGKIIFGHHAIISERPKEYINAINIDTGCVFGGWLSCYIIENKQFYYKSVKANQVYYKRN